MSNVIEFWKYKTQAQIYVMYMRFERRGDQERKKAAYDAHFAKMHSKKSKTA